MKLQEVLSEYQFRNVGQFRAYRVFTTDYYSIFYR